METDETVIPSLTVKTLSDRTIKVDLPSEVKTIADIKRAIEGRGVPPASKQVIISLGRVLQDDEPTPAPSTILYLFYYEPAALLVDPIDKATDWDTKNRLKVFRALYHLSRRQFAPAAPLLIDTLTTFGETAFIPFRDCVKYAAIAGMLVLDRPSVSQNLIRSPELLEVSSELPHIEALITSFYHCRYSEFFAVLGNLEAELKKDWLLAEHAQYILKEMRIRAYSQILRSYRSLTLASMAASFGVSPEFIDRELCRFIAAERLSCTIDKVTGMVHTSSPDPRNLEYLALIKQGDLLANRMQKLSRLLNY